MLVEKFIKSLSVALLLSLTIIGAAHSTKQCQFGRVERAGMALVKDYGAATTIPRLRFAVLVGAERSRAANGSLQPSTAQVKVKGHMMDSVNFFGGKINKNEYTTVAAHRELYEETAKAINIPAKSLRTGRNKNYYGYAYSGDFARANTKGKNYIQMFFYRKDDASIKTIKVAMRAAYKNRTLPHDYREMNNCYAIPLQDILDRARAIQALEAAGNYSGAQDDANYVFESRGDGAGANRTKVRLDPQYMRNLARDITRDPNNLKSICSAISGGIVK